jgi:tetratricopeptide (TPR) repeat protein
VSLCSILALSARVALAGAVLLFVAPVNAPAQDVSPEEAAAYAGWQAASTAGDVAKATEIAQGYLKQFPTGQYADYLKKWLGQGQITALDAAVKEKRTADVIKIGNDILANDPENLAVIYSVASTIRGEMLARPPVYTNAAAGVELAKKGIALLESGKTLPGVDKNATLAWMTQMIAMNEQKAGNAEEAIKLFEKSTAYAPNDKAIAAPNLYSALALQQADYAEAAKAFNAIPEAERGAAEPTPAVKEARDKLNAEADQVIDVAARFVAFGKANGLPAATLDRVNQTLEAVYKTRFPEDTALAGLQKILQEKAAAPSAPSGD